MYNTPYHAHHIIHAWYTILYTIPYYTISTGICISVHTHMPACHQLAVLGPDPGPSTCMAAQARPSWLLALPTGGMQACVCVCIWSWYNIIYIYIYVYIYICFSNLLDPRLTQKTKTYTSCVSQLCGTLSKSIQNCFECIGEAAGPQEQLTILNTNGKCICSNIFVHFNTNGKAPFSPDVTDNP